MATTTQRSAGEHARARYEIKRAGVLDAFTRTADSSAPVRLAKRTSNLFRTRHAPRGARLDVKSLNEVIAVDPITRTADVEGMTTYETLVDATLPYGLLPKVVPELKSITLGGAVTGIGIESSSWRHGLVHESVREIEVLTGAGDIVVAHPDGEHAALFFAFPNSYGTLGYALRIVIDLVPVRPYVHLRHLKVPDPAEFFTLLDEVCATGEHAGEAVDFVDGVVFDANRHVLTLGTFTDRAPSASDYTWMKIYWQSLQERDEDWLTVRDYVWRWDSDWFWCSRSLRADNPVIRALAGRRFLRSDVYWKLFSWEERNGTLALIDRIRGRPEREMVVQDIEVPVERAADFLDFFHQDIGILPVWICPTRQVDSSARWTLYPMDPDTLYVNFGFWSSAPLEPGEPPGTHNRMIEQTVNMLGGRKSLYSTSYYSRDEFWRVYDADAYTSVKDRYDPGGRFLDLYAKCVGAR